MNAGSKTKGHFGPVTAVWTGVIIASAGFALFLYAQKPALAEASAALYGFSFGMFLAGALAVWLIAQRRARTAIEDRLSFLQTLVDTIPNPIFYNDVNGIYLGCNAAFETCVGLPKGEIKGKTVHDIFPLELADVHRKSDLGLHNAAGAQQYEASVRYADGSRHDILLSKTTFFDLSANVAGIVGVMLDITERTKAEKILENSEARLRQIINLVPHWIFVRDRDGNYLLANKALAESCQTTVSGLIGKSPADFYLNVQESQRILQDDREVMASGESGFIPEEPFTDSKGNLHLLQTTKVPFHTSDENIRAVLGVSIDITERKRSYAEAKLLASAVEQADENILITDNRRTIIYINPAFELSSGYRNEELKGEKLNFLRSAKHDEIFYSDMKETLDEGRVWIGIIFNKCKDGRDFEIEGTISPIRDAFGSITHYLAVGRNMSRFRKLERELYQAQKMESIGRLAGGVAHDFNNMLSVITGQTELALQEIDFARAAYKRLHEVLKAAHRSADLVRQLLAFARKQTINPRVLDINETVESMLQMLRRLIGEDIELLWEPGMNLWPVKMDPTQIDQILANMCVNARDALAGVGRVTISTGNIELDESYCLDHDGVCPGQYVVLRVSDTGTGMDSQTLVRIFEPFFTTKEVGTGTGLGLATVYGIIEQNQGFIDVQSAPGRGTTFNIYLPRTVQGAWPMIDSGPKKDLKGRETVLLVEDEEPLLDLGTAILQMNGYDVLAAKRPTEALEMVQNYPGPIQLLITDVVMPEMNGKEVGKRLAEMKPGLKTIFMSGYTADVIANHGILDESINFLQKPFSVQTMLEKVRAVLDG
ncbi:MAG: PAS domain S-box protein [Syntrophobacteraceae bacterium]|nr:PAS domain S-box protein [Syntrophobacteraceae bacterium]